jgi:phospholipid/cholesterol/gamma-HCH transport system substrate-binding protein
VRRLGVIGLLAAIAAAVALVIGTSAQGSDSYTFHVIFDDARGLIPGQTVKIAGAKAGAISTVTVTPDDKAEVTSTISGPFRFHADATCIIRPDGLIAENYLECDPGTNGSPLLKDNTVPVSHTSEPVSLLDLFNTFNLPTRERFQVLVDELGIATAGQGDNINAILQRANPTLQLAQKVIRILDGQTSELASAIDATNTIAVNAASHTAAVQSFLRNASSLTQLSSDHSSNLSRAIARLPGLLRAAQPALTQLDAVASNGTPLLTSINSAIPYLDKVDTDIKPFAALAKPALRDLSGTINRAIPAVHTVTPLINSINSYLKASAPTTKQFSTLIVNLLQHGFSESFLSVVYYVATALSHYDGTSHMLSSLLMFPNNGACASYSTKVIAGCQSHYGTQPAYVPSHRAAHHTTHKTPVRQKAATPTGTTTTAVPNLPTQIAGSVNKVISTLTGVASGLGSGVSKTLGGVGNTVSGLLGHGTTTTGSSQQQPQSQGGLQNLLNFLFK